MRSRDVINSSLAHLKEKKQGLKTSQSAMDREIQQVSKEMAFEDTLKGKIQTSEDDAYEKMLAISVKLSEQTGKDYRLILEPADGGEEEKVGLEYGHNRAQAIRRLGYPFSEYKEKSCPSSIQRFIEDKLDSLTQSLSSRFGVPTRSIRNRISDITNS